MTKLLKQAFDEASKLETAQQDSLATWLLDELASERRWEASFGVSQDGLRTLADEALREHRAGKSKPLDPTSL